jgi:excisionase family DNA binding protein
VAAESSFRERGWPMMDNLHVITIAEAVSRLSISRATLYRIMDRGEIEYVTVGKRRRIPLSEIERICGSATRATSAGTSHSDQSDLVFVGVRSTHP